MSDLDFEDNDIQVNRSGIPFTQIPDDFMDDKSISAEAFRIGCYMHRRPNGWVLRKKEICHRFDLKDHTWRNAVKELTDGGYLFIRNTSSGKRYYFSIMRIPPKPTDSGTKEPCVEIQRMGCGQVGAMRGKAMRGNSTHIYRSSINNINNNNKPSTNTYPSKTIEESSVVVRLEKELIEFGIDRNQAVHLISTFGNEKVAQGLEYMKARPEKPTYPANYLLAAIKSDYKVLTKPAAQSSHACHQLATDVIKARDENIRKAMEPGNREKGARTLASLIGNRVNTGNNRKAVSL